MTEINSLSLVDRANDLNEWLKYCTDDERVEIIKTVLSGYCQHCGRLHTGFDECLCIKKTKATLVAGERLIRDIEAEAERRTAQELRRRRFNVSHP